MTQPAATEPGVVVRPATTDDVPEIVRLKEVLMATGWPMDVEVDDAWRERCAQIGAQLVIDPTHGWFVVDAPGGAGLVGCVSVSIHQHLPGPRGTGRSAYLGDMVTDPAHQGRGIGSALLDTALAWAKEQGAGRVELYATPPGLRMYERAGFAPDTLFPHLSMRLG